MTDDPTDPTDPRRRGLVVESADPRTDARVAPLLDAAFERNDAESRLVQRLAHEHPDFDPDLALLARHGDTVLGWALFMPRVLRLAGFWTQVVITSPFAVHPSARRRGVASALLDAGLERARAKGARAAVVLGGAEFFASRGFAPAFRMYGLRVRADDLPKAGDAGWRGLQPDDLTALGALRDACYDEIDGTERRRPIALEWESQVPGGQTRLLADGASPIAMLRFRDDDGIQVREVSARSRAGVDAVLAYTRHLARSHGLERLDFACPPSHPVARALFHRGAQATSNDFGGEALLAVLDWPGLIRDTAPSWERRLGSVDGRPLSFEVGGQDIWIYSSPMELMVDERRERSRHLHVPEDLAPSLVTGHRSWRDLMEDDEVLRRSTLDTAGWRAVRAAFPDGEPYWSYGPVFEIADR